MVKFSNILEKYDCILSFDLAKNKTGFSFYNFKTNKIIQAGMINSEKVPEEEAYVYLYQAFRETIQEIKKQNLSFFVTKEKLPNQAGPRSTIATLQELAKVHAIFDLAVAHEKIDTYDYEGIHSVSVKAYFKKITNKEKPTKDDIRLFLVDEYKLTELLDYSLDVSDSLAVSFTLLNSKWEKDISEAIKILKKEKQKFKSEKKISEFENEIESLKILKEKCFNGKANDGLQ